MENNFAKYIDKILDKYSTNRSECFEKVKEFIEITKEVGGLTKRESKFIEDILTDENILLLISKNISCYRLYTTYIADKAKSNSNTYTSAVCGSSSRSANVDRCGMPIKDTPSVSVDRCGGGGSSRGC